MSNQASPSNGLRALYEMHLARLDSIKTGAAQRVYTEEEVDAFRRETAHLKAMLEGQQPATN